MFRIFAVLSVFLVTDTIKVNAFIHEETNCVNLPSIDGNPRFCGVTKEWKPIITKKIATVGYVVSPLVTFTIAIIVAMIWRCSYWDSCGSGCSIILQILWDGFDAGFDCIYFVYFSRNGLMNGEVHLNTSVKIATLVFAVLGALKIFLWIPVSYVLNEDGEKKWRKKLGNVMFCLTFFIEDGPEIILEYFYFEKYLVDEEWFLLAKDLWLE